MRNKSTRTVSLEARRARAGYVFTLPLVVGFIFLFFIPLAYSVYYSFQTAALGQEGGMAFQFVGLDNYRRAITGDTSYLPGVLDSLAQLAIDGPLILIFSFFIANLLHSRFGGRAFFRSVFFLPVVVTAGVVLMMQNDPLLAGTTSVLGSGSDSIESLDVVDSVWEMLEGLNLDSRLMDFVSLAVGRIVDIIAASGVQILVFLAGLQGISPSLYEASAIEGTTAWEDLWKITLPMISPVILVGAVYTVIDKMGSLANPVINRLYTTAWVSNELGYSAAMGWIYYCLMFVCVGFVLFVVSRFVYYEN